MEHATSDNPLCTSSGGSVSYVTVTSANLEKNTEDIGYIKQSVEKLVESNYNVDERSRISKPSSYIKNVEIINEEMETLDVTVFL